MKSAAIIGCGRPPTNYDGHKVGWGIAYAHAEGYRAAFPAATLYAVDPNADNLAAFAATAGLTAERCFASTDALYAAVTPDCVSICTWPGLHAPMAHDAIARGVRAILVEKPLALDTFQIRELTLAARNRGTRVAVAHQRRYEAAFIEARRVIASGALGAGLVLDARVGDDWDMLSWTVHWFDMASFLFDAPARRVLAGLQHTGQRRYGHAIEDASVVFVEYGGGQQASFVTGPAALPASGISVRGENGMLQIDDRLLRLWSKDGYREITPRPIASANSFAALISELWSTMGNDGISECDISRTAAATETAYAAHQSAMTRQWVDLPMTHWYAPLEVAQHAPISPAGASKRVTLLADAHAEWPGQSMSGRDGLHEALVSLGHHVTLLDAAADLAADALDATDVLVLYHTQRLTRDSHEELLGRWFRAGKPVVVSHCGIGAYANWPSYREWIGRFWVWSGEPLPPSRHPHLPCSLLVRDESFDPGWTEAWLPIDEMYQSLGSAAPVRELIVARGSDGIAECYAWQVARHPNVVAWLPGHRKDMFTLPVVRQGLRACIAKAVDGSRRREANA